MQTVPPTAGPLAACPHCGARVAKAAGPVRFEYGVGVVRTQRCDGCGAHWRYLWQEGKRKRRIGWRFPALIVLLAVAVGAGAVAIAIGPSRGPGHPRAWDARIRPIATRVEALRGLSFEHPVKVRYLSPAAFERAVAAAGDDSTDVRARARRTGALLRAMGLLGAHVDVTRAIQATRGADALAFYDDETQQISVRGTGPLTVDQRVTLAHELTHALQDQAFGLRKLRKRAQESNAGSVDAFTALVEGDATRIQSRYLEGLSQAERDDYGLRSLAASQAAAARTAGIPAVLEAYVDAPYIFGPPVAGVLVAEHGNASVDSAIDGPPPSTRIYLNPGATKQTPPIPPVPELLDGEKALPQLTDGDDHFEGFTFFLMLAAKLDLPTALQAADAFASGSQVAYTSDGRTCFRAAIDGVTRSSSDYLARVLRRWAATMPDADVSFTANGVLLRSCDPGARGVTAPDTRIRQAVRIVAGRDDLVASLARQPLPTRLAVCAARVLVQHEDFRAAMLNGSGLSKPTSHMVQESADAGRTCRANPRAGLP